MNILRMILEPLFILALYGAFTGLAFVIGECVAWAYDVIHGYD